MARNNMRSPIQNQQDPKGCYKCGGDDHWQKECPFDKQPYLRPLQRFCDDCMVTHFPLHCLKNPLNGAQTKQDVGNAPLNVVQVIPSGTEDEMVVPI